MTKMCKLRSSHNPVSNMLTCHQIHNHKGKGNTIPKHPHNSDKGNCPRSLLWTSIQILAVPAIAYVPKVTKNIQGTATSLMIYHVVKRSIATRKWPAVRTAFNTGSISTTTSYSRYLRLVVKNTLILDNMKITQTEGKIVKTAVRARINNRKYKTC